MTQEVPQQRHGYCTDCKQMVRVTRENRQLTMQCECESRSIRVSKATPMEWQL